MNILSPSPSDGQTVDDPASETPRAGARRSTPYAVVSNAPASDPAQRRFTLDGSDALEQEVADICDQVKRGIQKVIPRGKLEAIVLGGGYGRGEGGVLKTPARDRPYNDIEFYVFLRGSRHWNQRKYGPALTALEHELSHATGLDVEFKTDSLRRLRKMPVSMFTYDLVSAHRVLLGPVSVFRRCEHHLQGAQLPLSEATRLLFNRCSGLLLVQELLCRDRLTEDESDFVGRNLAKARLALGDAILVALGQYHWSVRARAQRLEQVTTHDDLPELAALRKHHRLGTEFKLHPVRALKAPEDFASNFREISSLARRCWLWIESQRLHQSFLSIDEYALSPVNKCPETARLRNCLLTVRTFGPAAMLAKSATRYPRERLFNSLPLLLWNQQVSREPELQRYLRTQLRSSASDWNGFVGAYKKIWPHYG